MLDPAIVSLLAKILKNSAVFIALFVAIDLAWNLWLSYIQTVFIKSFKWAILEIKPPKEVFKSPLAMELVLNSLHAGGQGGDWFTKYWKGEVSLYSSLEIVSIEGKVRFFMRIPEKFKKNVETQIYAQYPQVEISEVQDYTSNMPEYTKDGPINLWGCNFVLTKDDVYPIKSYIDYGLDRAIGSLEEEQRIDPITPMLEFLGSIGIGEQVWIQILIKPDTKRFEIKKGDEIEMKDWKEKAKEAIKEYREKLKEKDSEGKVLPLTLTGGQKTVIETIERHAGKFGFDAMIRAIYVAQKENFSPNRIGSLTGSFKQYSSSDLNGFKPDKSTKVDFPWQDLFGKKIAGMKAGILKAYKGRGFFYGGFKMDDVKTWFTHPSKSGGKPYILSTEELATIFHLPGRVVETPTFTRVDSKKSEPPANLPI